jgi:hypothetical protein
MGTDEEGSKIVVRKVDGVCEYAYPILFDKAVQHIARYRQVRHWMP